jgi:hypothetical protein
MRYVAMILLVAGALAACSGVAIGPVDHTCHVNPSMGQDSGCERHSRF